MKKIIIANWKMNPKTLKEAKRLFKDTQKFAGEHKNAEIIVCPPFVYLPEIFGGKKFGNLRLGAQDCFWQNEGAYTGEISPAMLKNLKVNYVIIGHSERRVNLGETDEMINKKIRMALKEKFKVIFCVGERKRDEAGDYFNFLKKEIETGLSQTPSDLLNGLLIAYEPIWAISSGKNAKADTPDDLFKTVIFIRKVFAGMFGKSSAFSVPILYGGSVNQQNAKRFLEIEGIRGLLVGGASLSSKKFTDIISAVAAGT